MAHRRCIRNRAGKCIRINKGNSVNKRRRGIIILARVIESGDRRTTEAGEFRDIEG